MTNGPGLKVTEIQFNSILDVGKRAKRSYCQGVYGVMALRIL